MVVGNTLIDTRDGQATGASSAVAATQVGRLVDERKVSLPGRDTLLRVRRTPQFDAWHDNASLWIVFIGGTLASASLGAALAILLRQQASLRTRAEALTERLPADLARVAQVACRSVAGMPSFMNLPTRSARMASVVWALPGARRLRRIIAQAIDYHAQTTSW